ncbi:cytochrome P450 [Amycolatopsis regifaucium]|uniref:NikQ protein n=1 Tax=Amycolatopsis regifaucium TaxID=546365 RepID=A0A154M6E3_9PSEU|nr:cytochrome P450 [Amycolatopsis regifaucium]KZB80191.1 NikQ protein [Amycolatopsis regifaucium]OKA09437.1 NikQ protein [Amycolatopsis regifaucium]SFH61327.1 hydroxylation protein CepL [Amycolatopsis regifaucium]
MQTTTAVDLGNPDLYTTLDRHTRWREFAAEDAMVWSEPGSSPTGFWSVFSHRACAAVLGPSAPFTSEYGMMIGFDRDHPDNSGGQMMVVSEQDQHRKLRKLVGPLLSRAAARKLSDRVGAEVRGVLDRVLDGEVCDVAAAIGPRIPAAVVCEILGVPAADQDMLIDLTNHAFGGEDELFDGMTPRQAHTEILVYFDELISARRKQPGDDLVGTLVADDDLTTDDVLLNCDNVLIGGNETTRHAITGAVHAFATVPGLLDEIRAGSADIDTVVDEVLRWTSPAMHVLRVSTGEVTINGRDLPSGTPVVAWLPAANRDPAVFDEPDTFRAGRKPNRHIAFGHGLHHCLGSALARIELAVVLREVAERVSRVELVKEPTWLRAVVVQGYRELAVRFSGR